MLPNVAIPARPMGHNASARTHSSAAEFSLTRRRSDLAAEARRLARRRSVAEGVARRGLDNDRNLPADASAVISERARRRSTRLRVVFHRAIESLWEAGGFDEALAIFREHKADVARRAPIRCS